MRQSLANLGGNERPFPCSPKARMRESHGFGGVIKNREANLLAQRRIEFFERRFEFFDEPSQRELCAENVFWVLGLPIPEQKVEFVIDKSGEHAVVGGTHELAEFGFGSRDF